MTTDSWQRVKAIFHEAQEAPVAERAAIVAAATQGDDDLRAKVEAMLAASRDAGGFLKSPTLDDEAPLAGAGDFERLQRAVAGRYSLGRELGRGGMGIVYLAHDLALDRPVAIKLLPSHLGALADFRTRFLREARTAAGLSHPNIVPIHLVEAKDEVVFFVMAYVAGESLGERVRRGGPLKPADAAKLVQEVAWALGYAHGRGVIHRDVKPDNILIDSGSGRALVTDFGIARVASQATVSGRGEILGTLRYMSPEQAGGDDTPVDGRSDLYSLGVTAFFALTGRPPFEAANPAALVAMHLSEPAPPVRSLAAATPAGLAAAVDRCLAKDPGARHPSGEALAEAIGDTQVARKSIAPSVSDFLGAARNAAVQIVAMWLIWIATAEVAQRIAAKTPGLIGEPLDPLLAILVAITPLVMVRPLLAARGVLRAGLTEQDVADGAVELAGQRDANVEYEQARLEALARRLASPLGRVFFGLVAIGGGVGLIVAAVSLIGVSPNPYAVARTGMLGWALMIEAFVLAVAIAPRWVVRTSTRGTPEHASALRKIWGGWFGRGLLRLAGIGLARKPVAVSAEPAPTEVLLGRAATDLLDQLPGDVRGRLGDVRGVVSALERAATGLRSRRDDLASALAGAGAPGGSDRRDQVVRELDAARGATESRLATTVAALDNLRLDLLRLRAGVGDVDDLTASLEEARAVGASVDIELAARREVDALT